MNNTQISVIFKPNKELPYPQPLLLCESITVVHIPALTGSSSKYLFLLFFTREPFNFSIVLNNPGWQFILLHQAGLALGVSGIFSTTVHVHTLKWQMGKDKTVVKATKTNHWNSCQLRMLEILNQVLHKYFPSSSPRLVKCNCRKQLHFTVDFL